MFLGRFPSLPQTVLLWSISTFSVGGISRFVSQRSFLASPALVSHFLRSIFFRTYRSAFLDFFLLPIAGPFRWKLLCHPSLGFFFVCVWMVSFSFSADSLSTSFFFCRSLGDVLVPRANFWIVAFAFAVGASVQRVPGSFLIGIPLCFDVYPFLSGIFLV